MPLSAWSSRFHEAQTELALSLIPKNMAVFLRNSARQLRDGARGIANDQVPTVEEIEAQYHHIVEMSLDQRNQGAIVKEIGTLAHMVQLLTDPSATLGLTPLRDRFETYGDENLPKLMAYQEPYWALQGPLDPRPQLLTLSEQKFERHRLLLACVDPDSGQKRGTWDVLSLPFAQLQLAYSNGVNATANLWILLWREAGAYWAVPGRD